MLVRPPDPDPYQNVTDPEHCFADDIKLRTYTDLHELLADGADVLAEGGGEHHHLLLVRRRAEYLLHQVKPKNKNFPEHAEDLTQKDGINTTGENELTLLWQYIYRERVLKTEVNIKFKV